MNEIVDSVKDFILRAFDYTGRSTRPQFWYVILTWVVVSAVLGLISQAGTFLGFLSGVIYLAIFIPFLALGARRLRDGGFSPYLMLLLLIPFFGGLIVLILCALPTKAYGTYPLNQGTI